MLPPPMRRIEIQLRTDGDDPVGVNRLVRVVVVPGDMVKPDSFGNAGHLV